MTTAISPRDLLSSFTSNARAIASSAGHPTERSAFPGLAVAPTAMVYVRGEQLIFHPLSAAAIVLTPEIFTEELVAELSSVVVSDSVAFGRLAAVGDMIADDDYGTLSRRLRTARGMDHSVKLPLLTDALSSRYWLQEELDTEVFEDWVGAFSVKAPSESLKMRALIAFALNGSKPESLGYEKHVASMESLEQRIMHNVNWSGISTDCQVYSMLESANTKADTLRLMDPLLLEMHVIDGQVCKINPMEVFEKSFIASVSVPFKLKEDGAVILTDGKVKAPMKLVSLEYGDGVLRADFTMPSRRSRGDVLIVDSINSGRPLYIMEKPFDGFTRAPENKRWLGGEAAPKVDREVPADVLTAGA